MKKPNWEIAPKDATQWDTKFNVFCNKRGFWDSYGDFTIYNNQEEWGTPRYVARPTGGNDPLGISNCTHPDCGGSMTIT